MNPITQVADVHHVRLRPLFGKLVLQHDGTGEAVELEGAHRLCMDDEGFAHLAAVDDNDPDAPVASASTSLSRWLCYDSGDATKSQFIFDSKTGENTWVTDMKLCQFENKVCSLFSEAVGCKPEIFTSVLPKDGSYLRWGLKHLLHFVVGSEIDGAWVCRHLGNFSAFLAKFDYDERHVRRSAHSEVVKAAKTKRPTSDAAISRCDLDNCVSTEGLLMMLIQLATSNRIRRGHGTQGVNQRAGAMLHELVAVLSQQWSSEIQDVESGWARRFGHRAQGGFFITAQVACPAAAKLSSSKLKLGQAMEELALMARQPSKFRGAGVRAKQLLRAIINNLATNAELRRDTDLLQPQPLVDQPTLYREGSARPRKVSKALKLDVVDAVDDEGPLKSAKQLFAAQSALENKRHKMRCIILPLKARKKTLKPKSADSVTQCRMLHYLKMCRTHFHNARSAWARNKNLDLAHDPFAVEAVFVHPVLLIDLSR